MKGIVCGICGFISIDGVAPEKCPVCGAPKSQFQEKDGAYKTSKDIATYGESEKKHIPFLMVQKKCGLIVENCLDIDIRVGEIMHPMLPEHYIMRIDCYIDKKFIARVQLTPEKLNPGAGLHLKTQKGKFTAIELCSVHGAWMNEIDL